MKALINVPHPEAAHSIRIMLESVGFGVEREPNRDSEYIAQSLVYLPYDIPLAKEKDCDLYVAVKPEELRKEGKNLLFFINGGNHGENDFGVPTVTANFYFDKAFKCYVPWFNRLGIIPRQKLPKYDKPIGLVHGGRGWGFARYFPALEHDIDLFGRSCPGGILPQYAVKQKLSTAQCLVHLKSCDAPGYALYEAFASATPIVVSQFFVNNTRYHDLFIDGETCLIFGKGYEKYHHGSAADEPREVYEGVIQEIRDCIRRLADSEENYRIGTNGLFKWRELTRWTSTKRDALREYLSYNKLL